MVEAIQLALMPRSEFRVASAGSRRASRFATLPWKELS